MKLKSKLCNYLIYFLVLGVSTSCGEDEPKTPGNDNPHEPENLKVESIVLNETELALSIGETTTLRATVIPSDIPTKIIIWSTSDASVATVNDGEVTAIGEGTAIIEASCEGVSTSCIITVAAMQEKGKYQYLFGYAYSEDLLKFVTPTITLILEGQESIQYTIADGNITSAENKISFSDISVSVSPKWATIWWIGKRYEAKRTGKLIVTFERKDVDYSQFEQSWKDYEMNLLSKPFIDKSEGSLSINTHQWVSIDSKKSLKETIDEIISSTSNTVTF